MAQVDSLASALGSLLDFFHIRAMCRSPTLAALALLSWLVPLAALLPPATLSVENLRHLDYSQIEVPSVNFSSSFMFFDSDLEALNESFSDVARSDRLTRLTIGTATQGRR